MHKVSNQTPITLPVKLAIACVSIALLAGLFVYAVIYPQGSRPTCVSYEVNGDTTKLLDALTGFIQINGLLKQTLNKISLRAQGADLFLKWDQTSNNTHLVFLCTNTTKADDFSKAAKNLESNLQERVGVHKVLLQLGGEYSCSRSCEFRECRNPCTRELSTPIDSSQLLGSLGKKR